MKNGMRQMAIFLILVPSITLAAWRQGSKTETDDRKVSSESAWAELTDSMDKMHMASTALKPSGESDVDFVHLMLPHHQAAIDMAKAQLKYGNDPQMRRLAQEIITDQQSEIELMQLWLMRHEPATPLEKPVALVPAGRTR